MTVTASSADVYAAPSTASRTIGKVPGGTVLVVTRELGSWVKVQWSPAPGGVGYVHVSKGTIAHGSPTRDRAVASPSRSTQPAAPRPTSLGDPSAPRSPVYIRPPTHALGVGGVLVGPNTGFGASARAWRRDRFGIQVDVSHSAVTSASASGRMTSLRFEPSGLYSLPDRVTDYWWLRPYVGSGISLQRQTLTNGTLEPVHDSSLGFHMFGGGEVTFASIPRFTVGIDVGYRWVPTAFPGFDSGGLGMSVSGRWYLR